MVGVLGVISASLISSIIRTQNKTAIINEVRQNGDLVISKLERDIKQSESVTRNSATNITLDTYLGETIDWDCAGDEFTRDPDGTAGPLIAVSVTNQDPDSGVRVVTGSCNFTVSGGGASVPQIVRLIFTLEQRSTIARSEYQVHETFQVTAGTRSY